MPIRESLWTEGGFPIGKQGKAAIAFLRASFGGQKHRPGLFLKRWLYLVLFDCVESALRERHKTLLLS